MLQQHCQCKNTEYVAMYNHRTDCAELLTFNTNGNLLQISILTCVLRPAMTIARMPMYICMHTYGWMDGCIYTYVRMYMRIVYYVGVQHHDATLVNVYVFAIL